MRNETLKPHALALLAALVACFAAGSVLDLTISQALYNAASPLARAVEPLGYAPLAVTLSVVGATSARGSRDGEKRLPAWVLLAVLSFVLTAYCLFRGLRSEETGVPGTVVALVAGAAVNALVVRATSAADPRELRRWALGAFLALLAQFLIVNVLLKPVFCRPRMRAVAATPGLEYHAWWQIDTAAKQVFMAQGLAADAFASFPSGHVANAASLLALAWLPFGDKCKDGAENRAHAQRIVFWACAAFTAVIALARIVAGAHFLTDVSVGFAVQLLAVFLAL